MKIFNGESSDVFNEDDQQHDEAETQRRLLLLNEENNLRSRLTSIENRIAVILNKSDPKSMALLKARHLLLQAESIRAKLANVMARWNFLTAREIAGFEAMPEIDAVKLLDDIRSAESLEIITTADVSDLPENRVVIFSIETARSAS